MGIIERIEESLRRIEKQNEAIKAQLDEQGDEIFQIMEFLLSPPAPIDKLQQSVILFSSYAKAKI